MRADPGPAPLRRLTRFEYGRTLADLTGVDPSIAASLPPDEESLGYDDIASAYSVSSLHASRYLETAERAAAALLASGARLAAYAGCDPTSGDDGCVAAFVAGFGRRAWRRPLDDDERQAMLDVYAETADPTLGGRRGRHRDHDARSAAVPVSPRGRSPARNGLVATGDARRL